MSSGRRAPLAAGRSGRPWVPILLLSATFVFLRLPSLAEPTWYSDEGTYADIGRSLLHGATLYHSVWDNKPPGMYWLAAAVVSTVGPRAPAFHALLAIMVAIGAVATWRLGRRIGDGATATLATLIFIVVVSLPNLEGNLLNAEVTGAVLVLWAMVLLTGQDVRRWQGLVAGVLLGAAFLFKAVFALDILAGLAVPLWMARAGRRPRREAKATAISIAAGAVLAIGLACLVLALQGSLGGLVDVLLHQDISYVQLTNGPAGSVLTSTTSADRVLYDTLLVLRVAVPLLVLGIVSWRFSRRRQAWPALISWWLGCDLAGAMLSSRGFPHYVEQAEGALALAAAGIAVGAWRKAGAGKLVAILAVLATGPVLQLVLVIPRAEVAWANNRPFPGIESDSFTAAQVGQYYRLGWERLFGRVSSARYEAFFPTDLRRQRATVQLFRQRAKPGDRVFVWGTIHWSYALSDRLPAGRYVSLNSAFVVDRRAEPRLIKELASNRPVVLVVDVPLPAPVLDMVQGGGYVLLRGAAGGDDAWVLER